MALSFFYIFQRFLSAQEKGMCGGGQENGGTWVGNSLLLWEWLPGDQNLGDTVSISITHKFTLNPTTVAETIPDAWLLLLTTLKISTCQQAI